MVTIDRERLVSEKQNNKGSPEGARLPKEAMLLRDVFKFAKPSLDAFRPFGSSAGLTKSQKQKKINWSQIHITTFLWVGISVKTNTFFAFLEKHLTYH